MKKIILGFILAVILLSPITRHDVGVILGDILTLVLHIGQVLVAPLTSP